MKILIADDSPTIVNVLQFLLQSQGYEVVTASDGIEAISKTYETRPDLVLLDIEMPKMNGYQVCRLLKSDQATSKIPIVILTSRGQKRDRFWGLSTGADEFITKDFESEQELFAAIRAVLQRTVQQVNSLEKDRTELNDQQPPKIRSPITEISVLEHVNHILDRQLFQATIVNELGYLAIHMFSFSDTMTSLFNLLGKVSECQVAAVFLKEKQGYHNFLYIVSPISRQFLEIIKQRVIDAYKTHQPLETLTNIEITILHDTPPDRGKHVQGDQVMSFFALPLKVRNDVIGVLALGSTTEKTFTSEVIDTLHVFTKEASIVLDNALLVKQLEQSNLELEKTISELKTTQSQLVQSEKMASLGQLVAGVAHEINTPAGAINAASSNLIDFLSSVPESFRTLAQEHVTPEDLDIILLIVSELTKTISQERKSTIAIRQDTENLEKLLTQEGLANARRSAKQIARFHLNAETLQVLRQLFERYNPDRLIDFLEKCSKIVNASKDIRMSIEMITRIVNALKLYSRLDQAKVEEIDIHEGIETTLIILQNQMKYGIVVERNFGDIPKIPCYANELNQVWTNIIHNAIQAMDGSGTLTIDTYLLPERKIGIRITDSGPGIPEEIRDKIFDPYFTTKDQGEGSGLGLGIARHIVLRHHGEIRVTSTPAKTSFEVLLPISGVQEEYLAR